MSGSAAGVAAARETVRDRSYVKDDGIDREFLTRRNAALLIARGEDPATVAEMYPDLALCPWCGWERGFERNRRRRQRLPYARGARQDRRRRPAELG